MLNYSFASVYMAAITSNILLILITLLFWNRKIMINAGYKLLALFIVLSTLRVLLPFEFPFTITIRLSELESISQGISYIRRTLFFIDTFKVSRWTILQIIWGIGFVISLIHYIRLHMKSRYLILASSLDATTAEPYCSILDRICTERGKRNSFQILTVTGIRTPMLYGIFSPHILIPENLELSEEEWYFTLSHEASHHFHHDLLIKTLVSFITMVYWWNPASYVLNRQANVILEMRVDNVVTLTGQEAVKKYLRCLTAIGEKSLKKDLLSRTVTMGFFHKKDDVLTQRYDMLTSTGKRKNKVINILLFVLVISIYAASHLFIFEAFYTDPDAEATSVEATSDIVYAIQNENNTYDIYYKGLYIETTDSLDYYSSDIPVYTEKEIAYEEH